MATRVTYPLFKAFTADGTLGIGYKLYTYKAGTNNPLTTYQDDAATIPHTNPIILDSLGEAEIFLTESAKFTLTDADDSVVNGWPVDNINVESGVAALAVSFSAYGSLSSTNVQAAIEELSDQVEEFSELEIDIPTGLVVAWPTETVPSGFLECDGSAISRVAYADLFLVISDTYGAGDGSTTFNLPDYRGEFLRGWDHGAGNDPDAASRTDSGDETTGDHVGTKQGQSVQAHRHIWSCTSGSSGADHGTTTIIGRGSDVYTSYTGDNETRPRNVAVMWIIKY